MFATLEQAAARYGLTREQFYHRLSVATIAHGNNHCPVGRYVKRVCDHEPTEADCNTIVCDMPQFLFDTLNKEWTCDPNSEDETWFVNEYSAGNLGSTRRKTIADELPESQARALVELLEHHQNEIADLFAGS